MDQIDRVFRQEKGKIVAGLVRLVGSLESAEDCFSEAVEAALKFWPERGIPENPAAWIHTAAKRKGLDLLRAQKRALAKQELTTETLEESDHQDERLSLIFTCCHPALSMEARLGLTLRTLCGLTTPQIASAFLVPEATMAQRLVRAQKKIRDSGIPYRIPPPELLHQRLHGVLATLYLMFNEGYWSTQGESLQQVELCLEAVFLTKMLVDLMPKEAEPLGLLALMQMQHSRKGARINSKGEAVTLEFQDRSLWDREFIQSGYERLHQAMQLGRPGPYQIQAAIAVIHCYAKDAPSTDWAKIVALYDSLLRFTPTPVVALNRAVAVSKLDGPESALKLLEPLSIELQDYALYHSTRAELLMQLGQPAATDFEKALSLEKNAAARQHYQARLEQLRPPAAP